jgi:hypothetical protein
VSLLSEHVNDLNSAILDAECVLQALDRHLVVAPSAGVGSVSVEEQPDLGKIADSVVGSIKPCFVAHMHNAGVGQALFR